jgi:hypothetical protein
MSSQGMPEGKPTVDVPDYDPAKSREQQLKHHGEENGGKKDGYRTGNKPEVAGSTG